MFAILMVFLASVGRCLMPLGSMARRLRRAARIIITENKQNKEKKSWNVMLRIKSFELYKQDVRRCRKEVHR